MTINLCTSWRKSKAETEGSEQPIGTHTTGWEYLPIVSYLLMQIMEITVSVSHCPYIRTYVNFYDVNLKQCKQMV